MTEPIKWDVWGHKEVIVAETAAEAVRLYRERAVTVAPGDRQPPHNRTYPIRVEAVPHQSDENAETLMRQRDSYQRLYELEITRNKEAKELLAKIHEQLEESHLHLGDED